mgnify:CR=1 FL=1
MYGDVPRAVLLIVGINAGVIAGDVREQHQTPFLAYALARRTLFRPRSSTRPLPPWAVWALLALVLAFGILRNLPWKPVRWMAP